MNSRKWISLAALMAVLGLTSWSMADDDKDKDDKEAKEQKASKVESKFRVTVLGSKHWIGVMAHPIDDALRSQLGLKERAIVHHVAPNSPADKAGLKQFDVLLSYGGKDVTSLEDLAKAVAELGDKESKLVVLRGGKEATLTVKPEDRPSDDQLKIAVPHVNAEEIKELILSDVLKGDGKSGTITWRGLGPAISGLKLDARAAAFPKGTSLSITKENDAPAKIVVKKDDKTYEATEDKLNELPDDIRGLVERSLHGPRVMSWSSSGSGPHIQIDAEHFKELRKNAEAQRKMAEEHAEKARAEALKAIPHRIEVRRAEGSSLEELRKEIEGLRKEIQEMRKSGKSESGKGESKSESKD